MATQWQNIFEPSWQIHIQYILLAYKVVTANGNFVSMMFGAGQKLRPVHIQPYSICAGSKTETMS